jgi:hypothetical protein
MNKFLGPEFMSKLYGDMQLTLSRDHRQLVDWLAAGKAAICVPCDDAELGAAKEQRLPVEVITHTLKECDYIAGGQGVISLITPAPHPHAANFSQLVPFQGRTELVPRTLRQIGSAKRELTAHGYPQGCHCT